MSIDFLLGLLAVPVLAALAVLLSAILIPNTVHGECLICGFETSPDDINVKSIPLVRWLKWRWHAIAISTSKKHRRQFREWQAERAQL